MIDNFRLQIKRGLPFKVTLQSIAAIIDTLIISKAEGGIDDRLMVVRCPYRPRGIPLVSASRLLAGVHSGLPFSLFSGYTPGQNDVGQDDFNALV